MCLYRLPTGVAQVKGVFLPPEHRLKAQHKTWIKGMYLLTSRYRLEVDLPTSNYAKIDKNNPSLACPPFLNFS